MKCPATLVCAALPFLFATLPAHATLDPTQLSLEDLMNIEITSVAKKSQRLGDAAAAITVITHEDIRRSGAANLPELLRGVPGVQVSRIDASRYAVSMRGFSNRFASKLLVLLDGRTLYTPLFAGVYWEAHDVLLEDVERIEVIRGPGGTLWGANAVNGVINIITRASRDTQGTYLEANVGTLENGVAVRQGGTLGAAGHFRAQARFDGHDDMAATGGGQAHDAWRQGRAGFRADVGASTLDRLTLQGDIYAKHADQMAVVSTPPAPVGLTRNVPDTARLEGANLLFRWERGAAEQGEWKFQAYVDQTRLRDAILEQRIDTYDLEFQHRIPVGANQEITWGAGYRHVTDTLAGGYTLSFRPATRHVSLYSLFAQDELRLREDLRLTVGSKFEHNGFTGFEYQPSARLLWQATESDNLWAAVSRAVQTPARIQRDSFMNYQMLGAFALSIAGNPQQQAESLKALEFGYRGRFGPSVSLDAAVFFNRYEKLMTLEPIANPLVSLYGNGMSGRTRGIELAADWQVRAGWRLHGTYSRIGFDLRAANSIGLVTPDSLRDSTPRHMASLQSRHDLGRGVEFDAALYRNTAMPALNVAAHTRLDVRLGWHIRPDLELSLAGRNLTDRRHIEYQGMDVAASEVPRSLFAQIKLRY